MTNLDDGGVRDGGVSPRGAPAHVEVAAARERLQLVRVGVPGLGRALRPVVVTAVTA